MNFTRPLILIVLIAFAIAGLAAAASSPAARSTPKSMQLELSDRSVIAVFPATSCIKALSDGLQATARPVAVLRVN
jgi:hypothetical protein